MERLQIVALVDSWNDAKIVCYVKEQLLHTKLRMSKSLGWGNGQLCVSITDCFSDCLLYNILSLIPLARLTMLHPERSSFLTSQHLVTLAVLLPEPCRPACIQSLLHPRGHTTDCSPYPQPQAPYAVECGRATLRRWDAQPGIHLERTCTQLCC